MTDLYTAEELLRRFPPVLSASEMLAADAYTIENLGISSEQLMERAGQAVFREILKRRPEMSKFIVLCGKGNNGGDGLIVARCIKEAGRDVRVVSGEALATLTRADFVSVDCVVDALYGIRFRGTIEEAGIVESVNEERQDRDLYVVAVDLPSGFLSNTGTAVGPAFECDLTVTFQAWKPVHFCFPGAQNCGERVVVDIGIELKEPARAALLVQSSLRELALESTLVSSGGHKGTRGHLVIVAGSPGHSGAAALCARAAFRSGAGLVTVVTDRETSGVILSSTPEAMTADGFEKIGKPATFVIGPGLGDDPAVLERSLVAASESTLVVDAAGLRMLAKGTKRRFSPDAVLTPHPGELADLLQCTTAEIQGDRFGSVRRGVEKFGCCVVLKGAHTLIGLPGGSVFVSPVAHGNLGTAGAGDVLAGLIGGLLARGIQTPIAAILAVYLHGQIGAQLLPQGVVGSLASEFADAFPEALTDLLLAEDNFLESVLSAAL